MATILLVEDHPVQRRLLYHALKRDHTVLEAAHAEEALRRLRSEVVDLVILDLHMPPEPETPAEGLRLHAAIRRTWPGMPIIVTTATTDPLVRSQLRRWVTAFLSKPVDLVELEAAIRRATGPGSSLRS